MELVILMDKYFFSEMEKISYLNGKEVYGMETINQVSEGDLFNINYFNLCCAIYPAFQAIWKFH